MDSRTGRSRAAASASACGVHCCQCTGLSACWRRYGLVARPSGVSQAHVGGASSAVGVGRRCRRAVVGGLIGLGVLAIERFGHFFNCLFIDLSRNTVAITSSTTTNSPIGLALPKSGPVLRGALSDHGEQKVAR